LKTKQYPKTLVGLLILGSLLLSACGAGDAEPTATPTMSVEYIQTMAVAEFASGLTQTALAMPTNTPTFTPSPTMTNTPMPTPTVGTPGAFGAGAVPTTSCYGLSFVSDVNIPDNTPMKPGQTFTKTWRVKNTGTCTWDAGFKLNFTGGDPMGGTALLLDKAVSPGAEVELSVAMIAPSTAGTIRGNWRMSTATGTYFGDEIYLIIVVGSGTSVSSTTVPATETSIPPTATETTP
jgi:hypothetical protein